MYNSCAKIVSLSFVDRFFKAGIFIFPVLMSAILDFDLKTLNPLAAEELPNQKVSFKNLTGQRNPRKGVTDIKISLNSYACDFSERKH